MDNVFTKLATMSSIIRFFPAPFPPWSRSILTETRQVCSLEYEGGITATMTMSAFTEDICDRGTRIHGTKGELIGDMKTFVRDRLRPSLAHSASHLQYRIADDSFLYRLCLTF